MARKYDALDQQLLQWLRENTEGVTTAAAIKALGLTTDPLQRHISRRFSLLENKGALVCELRGTTRVCRVIVERLPPVLHKGVSAQQVWRTRYSAVAEVSKPVANKPPAPAPSIPARNSNEFLAAGGSIERLPSHWDKPAPSKQLGSFTLLEYLSELD